MIKWSIYLFKLILRSFQSSIHLFYKYLFCTELYPTCNGIHLFPKVLRVDLNWGIHNANLLLPGLEHLLRKRGPSVIRKWWLGFEPACGINSLGQSEPSTGGPSTNTDPATILSCAVIESRRFCVTKPFFSTSTSLSTLSELFLTPSSWLSAETSPDRQTASSRGPWAEALASRWTSPCPGFSRVIISCSGRVSDYRRSLSSPHWPRTHLLVGALEFSRSASSAVSLPFMSSNSSLFAGLSSV